MRFLVIGASKSAEVLAEALREPNQVEQLQSADDLFALSREANQFDWVFVDDSDPCVARFAEMTLSESNSEIPVSRVSAAKGNETEPHKPMPICAVEQTSEGMQILRCALRHAVHSPDGDPALRAAVGERPLAFEYHAPIRKTG